MKTKVSEASGIVLDWMVAKAEGFDAISYEVKRRAALHRRDDAQPRAYQPSSNWVQGGPIIDKMKSYCQEKDDDTGRCYCSTPSVAEDWHNHPVSARGGTPLIAAMRCYVKSKLGDEVDVPEELK